MLGARAARVAQQIAAGAEWMMLSKKVHLEKWQ